MAHRLSHEQIDTAAAEAAAKIHEQQPESAAPIATLAYGAKGEDVTRLVDLLALLGYDTNNVVKGAPPILDESVLADVRAAATALGVSEPDLLVPSQTTVGVRGELVGESTWSALYAAAEAKLEAAGESDTAGGASGA